MAAVLLCSLTPVPAQAQYWGNLPYMAQSTLWPLTRLFGFGYNGFGYNNNALNPYYLTNMAASRAAINSGYFRAPGYGPLPMGTEDYTDEEPLNNPRQRVRPYRIGQFGVDKNVSAGWAPAQDANNQAPGTITSGPAQAMAQTGLLMPEATRSAPSPLAPTQAVSAQSQAPSAQAAAQGQFASSQAFGTGANPTSALPSGQATSAQTATGMGLQSNSLPPLQTYSSTMPPIAPSRHGKLATASTKHGKHSQANQQSAAAANAAAPNMVQGRPSPAPLAAGFVDLVNMKYDGDISKALFNTDTRAWAHAVGLVDNEQIFGADLSQSRITLMSGIMKDPSLDAVSKLDAVKILLRGATTATPVAGH